MLEPEEAVALWYLAQQKKNVKKKRRVWVRPILSARLNVGSFYTLFEELMKDDVKFFDYFRMSRTSFEELYSKLEVHISKMNSNMRRAIPAKERLAATLRYLASGCTLTELQYNYRIGISTLSGIIQTVCHNIWNVLKDDCMPDPSKEDWLRIAKEFEDRANFPNCIGALGGKYLRIAKPEQSTIVLLVISDANYRFTAVDINKFGKTLDSMVFKNSALWRKLHSNDPNLPDSKPLPETDSPKIPYVTVADEGFGLTGHVMRPYFGKNLSALKKVYNYRINRARRYVECSFGILTNKWRIFNKPLKVSLESAEEIVKACVILHNFVIVRDGFQFEDTLTVEGLEWTKFDTMSSGRDANIVRDKFANYFQSVGKVPWQDSRI